MPVASEVPIYKLYGEREHWPAPEMVHCESIASRGTLHNWRIAPHRHNGLFQILYLKDGKAKVQLEDQQHDMRAGQILMVPQMCVHGFTFDRNAVGHVVTLAYSMIHKLTEQAGDGLVALTSPGMHSLHNDAVSSHIKMAFSALDHEYKGNAPYRNLLIESLLGVILIWLARSSQDYATDRPKEAAKAGEHFNRFSALIEEHYARHHPLAYYARQLGVTPAHLNALCRHIAGKSALALIHERMMLEAKRNLVYTSMTISVVSYTIGFSDPAYFTRFFKRKMGMSPKNFRKQAGI